MIIFGYVLSSVQSTVLQLFTLLYSSNDHTHEHGHEHPHPCTLYVPCNKYHTNTPYTHVRLTGSYEKTGWTDQLSRPKKKPRTRFQTLPTSPGGPIIGKSYTVRIDLMILVGFHALRWKRISNDYWIQQPRQFILKSRNDYSDFYFTWLDWKTLPCSYLITETFFRVLIFCSSDPCVISLRDDPINSNDCQFGSFLRLF
jgi:hypothetical protein